MHAQWCCAGHLQIWLINKSRGAIVARHKLESMHLLLESNGHYGFCRQVQKDVIQMDVIQMDVVQMDVNRYAIIPVYTYLIMYTI